MCLLCSVVSCHMVLCRVIRCCVVLIGHYTPTQLWRLESLCGWGQWGPGTKNYSIIIHIDWFYFIFSGHIKFHVPTVHFKVLHTYILAYNSFSMMFVFGIFNGKSRRHHKRQRRIFDVKHRKRPRGARFFRIHSLLCLCHWLHWGQKSFLKWHLNNKKIQLVFSVLVAKIIAFEKISINACRI